jgi:hypothetical protein
MVATASMTTEGRVGRGRELEHGPIDERDADGLGLGDLSGLIVPEAGFRGRARALQLFAAELAGAVGDGERRDDQVAPLNRGDLGTG